MPLLQELDAVGFVIQGVLTKIDVAERNVFDSIHSIFDQDIKENFRFLVTFSDGRAPSILTAIKEAKLPCKTDKKGSPCHQKFNNGTIYANNQDDEDNMSPIKWKNGMKNFKLFFEEMDKMKTIAI
jgi:hypothetical protein